MYMYIYVYNSNLQTGVRNLKESKEEFVRELGGRKGKGEIVRF